MAKSVVTLNRPSLFSAPLTRRLLDSGQSVIRKTAADIRDSNIDSTASFRYDAPGSALRSTQQIPLDWSLFENHTFFNSAQVKTNISFDRIINGFPFDGERSEIDEFLDGLTGYEKWVYDQITKNTGYLNFSGSYVTIADFAGTSFPDASRNKTSQNVLDPIDKSLTIEAHVFLPSEANDVQVIAQKLSGSSQGITLFASQSASSTEGTVVFAVTSGSQFVSASMIVQKGRFNHIAAVFNRRGGNSKILMYNNSDLAVTSSTVASIQRLFFQNSPLVIGSGSSHSIGTAVMTPVVTLSGSVDELRVWHNARSRAAIKSGMLRSVYPSEDLKLCLKFNEPTGSLFSDTTQNKTVLDSSGHSLHGSITGYTHDLRSTGSLATPMTAERRDHSPVLFPYYPQTRQLNEDLLLSASWYDSSNPNLITKLIPRHYLMEGHGSQGFSTENGTIESAYTGSSIPGSGKLGSSQIISTLLYTWAKFFDEIKIYIDLMSNVTHIDYDYNGTTADQFLPFLAKHYGLDLPNMFGQASLQQYVDGENTTVGESNSVYTLQQIQNQVWRRLLINVQEIIKSKGTIHSIKAFIRSMGINPDTAMRMREFGGETENSIKISRENKTEVSTLMSFSGSMSTPSSVTLNAQGIPSTKPFILTQFLSSSRVEVGNPIARGQFVSKSISYPHGTSGDSSDGLLTSGSWTYEAVYRFPKLNTGSYPSTQSLCRIHTTGTSHVFHNVIFNTVLISGTIPEIKAYVQPVFTGSAGSGNPSFLVLPLTGCNLFDGNKWSVSFGRTSPQDLTSSHSSSYYIRAARQSFGEIVEEFSTSSFYLGYDGLNPPTFNGVTDRTTVFSSASIEYNASGCFAVIGTQSLGVGTGFLNSQSFNEIVRSTEFAGRVGHIKLWSKSFTPSEWREHVINFKSNGVSDPKLNYGFTNKQTGSWERLRMSVSTDQSVTSSTSVGDIYLIDFSQNSIFITGSGFETSKRIIHPETFYFSQISPKFDEASSNNKIRIRGYQNQENIDRYSTAVSPSYAIEKSETPTDDTRFTIDFSVIDALDQDIVTIFSTLDSLDNAIGSPDLLSSCDYPDLENLRTVYFNRLTDKINLKSFFEFFKWFDTSMGMFIEQLIPRKTNFLGINYVIESHMLERAKSHYHQEGQYLGDDNRHTSTTILMQEIAGTVKKF